MLSEQSKQRARQAPGLPRLSDYRRTQSRLSQTRPSSGSGSGRAALELNGLGQVNSIGPPTPQPEGGSSNQSVVRSTLGSGRKSCEDFTSLIQEGRLVFSKIHV